MMIIGIYPGSFDPLTNGHLDIIKRAVKLCDKLIVAVAHNSEKRSLYSAEERVDLLQKCCDGSCKIEITSFNGLLVDYCKENGVNVIFRGIRATSDFEYESMVASVNKRLYPEIETLFLMSSSDNLSVSSTIVKEIARYGGDVSSLVPQYVASSLKAKFFG